MANVTIPGTKKTVSSDSGWFVTIGCGAAVIASSTPLAPIAVGFMAIALIFQIEQLLKGQ